MLDSSITSALRVHNTSNARLWCACIIALRWRILLVHQDQLTGKLLQKTPHLYHREMHEHHILSLTYIRYVSCAVHVPTRTLSKWTHDIAFSTHWWDAFGTGEQMEWIGFKSQFTILYFCDVTQGKKGPWFNPSGIISAEGQIHASITKSTSANFPTKFIISYYCWNIIILSLGD